MKKILPAVALLLMTGFVANAQTQKKTPSQSAGTSKFAPPKVVTKKTSLPAKEAEFLKRNPTVDHVGWKNNNKIILWLKDATSETYNLANADSKKQFTGKYGTPPPPPPPPPPVLIKK
jgi:hypothetical protein